MARTKKRALFLATESSYGQDPDSDGSDYLWLPTRELGMLVDGRAPLRTDYFTGRNFPTAPVQGPDGWSFDCRIPLWGLAAAAGDGASVGADDVLDKLLTHIFGTQANVVGEGVNAGSGASSLVLDTSTGALQDVTPVYEASVPSVANGGARTQWAKKTDASGAPTYTIAPSWVQTPSTSAVAYGVKQYRPDDDGGSALALVYREDDQDYTLLGGRCTRAVIEFDAGGMITMSLAFSGDSKTAETKGSLPNVSNAPGATPLKGMLSPVWFNGTRYAIQKCAIDLGVNAQMQAASEATHGRGNYDSIALMPKVTINPLKTNAIQNLKRDVTTGRLLVQLGAGVLSGGVLNTMCFEAEEASVMDAPLEDESGRLRNSITFEVTDKVVFTGSTLVSPVFQLARA